MGVEGGSSFGGGGISAGVVSAGVSVGPAISAGSAIGLGSSFPEGAAATFATVARSDLGPIGGWGKDLAAPEPLTFESRSEASSSFVEGPSMFNPTDTIINSQPELNAGDAVSEAESILAQAARPQIGGVAENPDFSIASLVSIYGQPEAFSLLQPEAAKPEIVDVLPITKPNAAVQRNVFEEVTTKTDTVLATQTETEPQIAQTTSSETIQVNISPQALEQELEEKVAEKVSVEDPKERTEEELIEGERLYLEDEQAAAQRKYEVKEAIKKAKTEADRLGLKKIAGWLVARFLPKEHEGNRSQVVKQKGPDGSYQETVETIYSAGEFVTEQQALDNFEKIIDAKAPVKKGKNGRPVDNEALARVYKYHLVKPASAREIFQTRIIKKTVQVPGADKPQVVDIEISKAETEPSLEDFPNLKVVFNKGILGV